ncbi:MAG: Ribokinase [Deltaproteobacteria bacterium ADurb.Bin510]|nr:MAG: Ribokinase [Deltaproteobacteria bacterium ADurb.Bin510]
MPPQILAAGRICRDELLELQDWPLPDSKTHLKASLETVGGNAARAALCAAHLGAEVCLAGRVGDDAAGRFCLERLTAAGVDTGLVRIIPGGRTPHSHVLVCGPSRTVLAETSALKPLELDEGLRAAARGADVMLLDPAAAHLAEDLKRLGGAQLIYDHEPAAYNQTRLFELADWFVPGLGSLNIRRGLAKALVALSERVAGRLVVTAGARGAYFRTAEGFKLVEAPDVAARDTTGAGDNFHGALAVALGRGFSLEQAVSFAVAVASLSCISLGCTPPDSNEASALAGQLRLSAV